MASDRAAKTRLKFFGLLRQYTQSLFYVIGDNIAAKRDDRGVPYDVVIKDGDVSGSATDIDKAVGVVGDLCF